MQLSASFSVKIEQTGLGRYGRRAYVRRKMPDRLRAAIAGVGFIGPVHLRAARLAGAEIVGISGADPDRTRAAAAALGVARVFDRSEALAVDPGVDVIHICTPNHLHADLARRALVAGKHVVCEKPLACLL